MNSIENSQDACQVWDAVLGDLQLRVTRPSYETWLKDTVGVAFGDGAFVVGTPNAFVAEMLDQRMYSLISQSLERVVSQGVDVRFQVLPNGYRRDEAPDGRPQQVTVPDVNAADSPRMERPAGVRVPRSGAAVLNGRYTFESFIVGRSNELAHAAAQAVSENPGVTYNPLFIYSGVGLGKTHLLHAIGHQMSARGLSPIYATTEEFTNEYIKSIREGKTEEFRARYRSADALLLDDIQFIIGKEQTQEGFFHTFNSLHMAGRQVVITSDRPVTKLTLLEDRVSSRLAAGLVVDIQTPDLEMRMDILRAKAADTGQRFPDEVLDFLAERVHKNVRELEGNLNRIAAYAQLTNSGITIDLVKRAVADSLKTSGRRVSDEQVITAVCSYFSIDSEVLKGRRRDKETALARQIAMYLLREEANLTLKSIGGVLGGKDHTTVLHACIRISARLNEDADLRRDVINIREALANG